MSREPLYEIFEETEDFVLIRDLGPWDQHLTVSNGAEEVVEKLAPMLRGRRLEYFDSEGVRDQLLVRDGKFAGFAPVPDAAVISRLYKCPKCGHEMNLKDKDVWGKIVNCTNCTARVADNFNMPQPQTEKR